jgi:hypothetical protein
LRSFLQLAWFDGLLYRSYTQVQVKLTRFAVKLFVAFTWSAVTVPTPAGRLRYSSGVTGFGLNNLAEDCT